MVDVLTCLRGWVEFIICTDMQEGETTIKLSKCYGCFVFFHQKRRTADSHVLYSSLCAQRGSLSQGCKTSLLLGLIFDASYWLNSIVFRHSGEICVIFFLTHMQSSMTCRRHLVPVCSKISDGKLRCKCGFRNGSFLCGSFQREILRMHTTTHHCWEQIEPKIFWSLGNKNLI